MLRFDQVTLLLWIEIMNLYSHLLIISINYFSSLSKCRIFLGEKIEKSVLFFFFFFSFITLSLEQRLLRTCCVRLACSKVLA